MNTVQLLRLAARRTQQDLATLAGTSQSAVAACEGDRKSPTWRTVERLARAAGFEVEVRIVPALTCEERRSLLLHEAVAARLRAEPEAVLSRARELRHVTPFTGILSAAERARVYRGFAQRERDDTATRTASLDQAS